jgi:ferritin-like metal-binding protein YciE
MAVQTAKDLFVRELSRLQNVEQMLVQMMPQERRECRADDVSFDLRELAQIKQYAAASYRDLIDQAKQLGRTEVERFLQDCLNEEEAMGQQLQRVNQQFRKRWVHEPSISATG